MSYSDFTLATIKQKLPLHIHEQANLLADTPDRPPSELLQTTLTYNLPIALAINTEKSRSELIIAPILLELHRQFAPQISFFSGVDLNVDPSLGLNGTCDFIVSASPEQLMLTAPLITIVEAKKENLNAGLGQCIASMFAAQRFNAEANNPIGTLYGTVTTGNLWKFLRLHHTNVEIDLTEYPVQPISKILGILALAIPPLNA